MIIQWFYSSRIEDVHNFASLKLNPYSSVYSLQLSNTDGQGGIMIVGRTLVYHFTDHGCKSWPETVVGKFNGRLSVPDRLISR